MALIDTTSKKFRIAAAALSVGALLALSACGGGGGGGTAMSTGGPAGPGGQPDTGGQPTVTPLAPATGLAASAATPTPAYARSASDTLAALLPNASNSFAPLSSTLERNFGEPASASVTDDAHVKAISSDGANGFRVTYVIGTEEQTVHFEVGDYGAFPGESTSYYKEVAGRRYWLWGNSDSISGSEKNRGSTRFRYLDRMGTQVDAAPRKRILMTYGARTDSDRLPGGSATYAGDMSADGYATDDPIERNDMSGAIRLTVEFAEGALAGQVRQIWLRSRGRSWILAPASVYLDISDGRIVDGQLTAKWREVNPGDDDTFTGDLLGEFYGPGAEEVGGVINGANSEQVMAGQFGARKFELEPSVPADTSFQPLSLSGVDRDFVTDTVDYARDTAVRTIESDGANGFHVTYVVDGELHNVHLAASDTFHFPSGITYQKQQAGALYRLLDEAGSFSGAPEFSHFNVSEWQVNGFADNGQQTSIRRGFMTFGAVTDDAGMPSGSATYSGRAAGADWEGPDFADRTSFNGNLTLTADFDGGSIGGSITGITVPGASRPEVIDGSLVFDNGRISGSRFTADVTGAPLPPTVTRMAGTATGEFYGPAAAEVGGVFRGKTTGVDPDGPFSSVWHGWFGGRKQ